MEVNLIIAIYFLGVLGVGVLSYFKIKTPADYFVAGKKAGVLSVSGSLLATILGGSAILGTIELSQTIGWSALWFLFCAAFGLLVLIPLSKYVKRYGNYTMPEMLGTFYGKKAEIIASIIIPIAWTGIVAAQIIAAAQIISGLGSLNYTSSALISGTVFIVYTLIGGQLSILKTDFIQSILIVVGLFMLVFFLINSVGAEHVPPLKAGLLFNSSFTVLDLIILILTYSITFVVGPDIYSRVFCAKDEKTAAKSILIVAVLLIPVSFALTWLGIFSADFHGGNITSFAESLLPYWAYGLFIAALLSAVMSSADTTLLTSSIILSELTFGNLNHIKAMSRTRIYIVATGAISIVIALFVTSIIQALLFALSFFSGAFAVPVLAGLLKLKVKKNRVVIAILIGGTMALIGKIISSYYSPIAGNSIIILTYVINSLILFLPAKKKQTVL